MFKFKINGFFILFLFFLASCAPKPSFLKESGSPSGVPSYPDLPFSQYVQDSRENIEQILRNLRFANGAKPYLGEYSAAQAAEMRGPFEHLPEKGSTGPGKGKGFLLIHGLTDSPYLMRSIADSLHQAYPNGTIRAVLLPGHGTVAGDSLNMKHTDWMAITDYGVRSFEKMERISDLYLVGFSTGTALAIRHLQNNPQRPKIKGLILISTAVKAKSGAAFLSPYLYWVKDWLDTFEERDAARYESFSVNAGAEFYLLTKNIMKSKILIDVPVLMAVSADDETIDANAARQFFCDRVTAQRRGLIWYASRHAERNIDPPCEAIKEVKLGPVDREFQGTVYRFANYAHTALSMSPADPHYGVNGKYHQCKAYDTPPDMAAFNKCQKGSAKTIFGEKDIASKAAKKELDYDYWRRGTFNPDYPRLERAIICFVDEACDLQRSLDDQ
ncbi:esterase [Desulfobacter hydrogenophilus]|uniref:Alpha/beta fold hydrolase n=1 Tax=Desulfobacter hydrogenophilus TaxID=2291 RepID=A0A328F8J4_9BACT|nr:alpha/beta fold hydrolase [Desulfobacter hydrogenophilus]NDY73710.1 alpha/beta fold hydrolase [Desulfobacter hydrogenophilus]QBH11549.1 alpha/beta fold hydrolase [Desulfobacter hydrogenophilus]RAM00536.1 esterase [Desulfobacter hydrogenophilus]